MVIELMRAANRRNFYGTRSRKIIILYVVALASLQLNLFNLTSKVEAWKNIFHFLIQFCENTLTKNHKSTRLKLFVVVLLLLYGCCCLVVIVAVVDVVCCCFSCCCCCCCLLLFVVLLYSHHCLAPPPNPNDVQII